MDPVVFTSANACDRIAGRTVRNLSAGNSKAAEIVKRILAPFSAELGNGMKTQRGALKRICRAVVQRLQEEESLVSLHFDQLYSELSTKESYDLRFIMTIGCEEEQFVEFISCQAFLTRRSAKLTLNQSDFFVHRHALARFMQRERKPLSHFFAAAIEPLRCSTVIAPASAFTDSENVALPMGDGMLLGKMTFVDADDQPIEAMEITIEADGETRRIASRIPSIIKDRRCIVELLTYVDKDAMTYTREELYDKLAAFSQEHGPACQWFLDSLLFPDRTVTRSTADHLRTTMSAACSRAQEIVAGPEWEFFTQTARK